MNYEIKIQSQDLKPASDFRNGTNCQEVVVQRQPVLQELVLGRAPNLQRNPILAKKKKKKKSEKKKRNGMNY